MSEYTFEDVKRTLHEVVAERPDYVYEPPEGHRQCVYADDEGNPSCLWGHVIQRLDPEAFTWIQGSVTSVGALAWAEQFDYRERRAMRSAQISQDSGGTWGDAEEAFNMNLEARA
jgi:hypothetical protein